MGRRAPISPEGPDFFYFMKKNPNKHWASHFKDTDEKTVNNACLWGRKQWLEGGDLFYTEFPLNFVTCSCLFFCFFVF